MQLNPVLTLASFCLAATVGCGGGGGTPAPPAATHLSVTTTASAPSGAPVSVTVSALDASGTVVPSYSGTVHFSSSDPQATLPSDSPLAHGAGTYQVTFRTAGVQTVSVSDASNVLSAGRSNSITIGSPPASQLSLSSPPTITAGVAFTVVVTALDQTGNVTSNYAGTVHFASSDAQAQLPADVQLAGGSGAFQVTLRTKGTQSLTATDTVSTGITGKVAAIQVVDNSVTHFSLTTTSSAATRATFGFSVVPLDAANNISTGYSSTVHFASSDPQAKLPPDTTVTSNNTDFSATFETAGMQSLTATDVNKSALTATASVSVTQSDALSITSSAPPDGTVGFGYNPHIIRVCQIWSPYPSRVCLRWQNQEAFFFPLTASGGVPGTGYTWGWAAAPGSTLPNGLNVGNQNVSGIPAVGSAGTHTVLLTVTDNGVPPAHQTNSYTITIKDTPPPVISVVPPPPGATLNQPFLFTFAATSGLPPLSWSETGALPAGLSPLAADGELSGKPTSTGSFPITVNVQDSLGQKAAAQTFTLQVYAHGFAPTGNMQQARLSHTATLLRNGKVLVTGGHADVSNPYASAELFDPIAGTFSATGSMQTARSEHTATLLCDPTAPTCGNSKVLVAGGFSSSGPTTASAELFDPATGSFAATGSLNSARFNHTATRLPNGMVLVVGGADAGGQYLAAAELYDATTGRFTVTGNLLTARALHSATLLPNGKVLIAGGYDDSGNALNSAELFDPATGTFTTGGTLHVARADHTATLLNNGKVLIAGGADSQFNPLGSAEIYDPSSSSSAVTVNLIVARQLHTAVQLPDGTVLMAGGESNNLAISNAELFDPVTNSFREVGGMLTPRYFHTATLLNDGTVLVTGGVGAPALSSAERYQ